MATFLRQRTAIGLPGIPDPALFTTYWDSTGATVTAIATESMARVRAFFSAAANLFAVNMTLTYNPVLDEIEETTGEIVNQATGAVPAAVAFTGTADILPLQVQGLIRLQTGTFRDGRRLQGRINLPYLKESSNDTGGSPTAAFVTAMTANAALLGTTVVTAVNQRVWSRPREATLVLPARAGLSAPVIARSCSPKWATLRSRRD